MSYDSLNRMTTRQGPDGAVWSYTYDAGDNLVATEDPLGYRTTTIYDGCLPIAGVNALGYRTTTTYGRFENVLSVTTPLGFVTTMHYNDMGDQLSTEDPLGYRTTSVYDTSRRVEASIDQLGYRTTYIRDAAGQVTGVLNARGYRTTSVYDAVGNVTESIDALGYRTTNTYDSLNRGVATQNARGYTWTTVYDAASQVTASVDPLGYRTTNTYTAGGLPATVTDPLGRVTTMNYMAQAPLLESTLVPLGYRYSLAYDTSMRQVGQIAPNGGIASTVYDTRGLTSATVDALSQRTTMGYDGAGRMTTQQNPRGQIQTLSYDAMNRMTGWQVQGGALVTLGYDPRSLTTLLMDGTGATTSTYDARAQMTLQQLPGGQNLTQTYDAVGNCTLLQYQEGTRFTYSYDARDQVTTLVRGSGTHAFGYDANGARTTWNTALGGVQTMAYDPRGYVTTISLTTPDSQSQVLGNTYDGAGRKTVRTEGGVPFTYSYDAGDRLTGQTSAGAAATFTYDTNTHLSLLQHQGQNPVTMTRNTLGQLTSRVQGTSVTDNDFDASGNIFEIETGGGKVEQTWDPVDRLVTEDFRGGDVWEYGYGADDLRRTITKNSAVQDRIVWLDGMPLAIHGSSWSTVKQLYTVLGSETLGTDEREFYGDELGHVMAWYDDTQAGSFMNSYWPYGELRSGTLPDDGLGYMGTLGVFTRGSDDRIYARRRFLDAENGSWISLDPLYPEELGYQYGAAMPVDRIDWDGNMVNERCNSLSDDGNVIYNRGKPWWGEKEKPISQGPCTVTPASDGIEVSIGLGVVVNITIRPPKCGSVCTCSYKKYKAQWNIMGAKCSCKKTGPHMVRCKWIPLGIVGKCSGTATQIIVDCFVQEPVTMWGFYAKSGGMCSSGWTNAATWNEPRFWVPLK